MRVTVSPAKQTTLLGDLPGIREKIAREAKRNRLDVVTTLPTTGLSLVEYEAESER